MSDFIHGTADTAATLARTTAPVVFVRGNHEDHVWLDQREKLADGPTFPIDAAERVHCLRTGMPWAFNAPDGTSLTVLGIGRVAATRPNPPLRQIQPYEQQRFKHLHSAQVDLLLTHDSIVGSVFLSGGMPEIASAIKSFTPVYHAFGHVGDDATAPQQFAGNTLSLKAADLHWDRTGKLLTPPFAVLRWYDRQQHTLTWVEEPWLAEYGRWTWDQ